MSYKTWQAAYDQQTTMHDRICDYESKEAQLVKSHCNLVMTNVPFVIRLAQSSGTALGSGTQDHPLLPDSLRR